MKGFDFAKSAPEYESRWKPEVWGEMRGESLIRLCPAAFGVAV